MYSIKLHALFLCLILAVDLPGLNSGGGGGWGASTNDIILCCHFLWSNEELELLNFHFSSPLDVVLAAKKTKTNHTYLKECYQKFQGCGISQNQKYIIKECMNQTWCDMSRFLPT